MFFSRIVYCFVAVILFAVASGPSQLQAQFRWGGQAGVNFATLDYSVRGESGTDQILGLIIGLRAEHQLSRRLAVYLAPQYVMKGSDLILDGGILIDDEGRNFPTVTAMSQRYEYLEFPLGLRMNFTDVGIIPYAFGGMTFAPLLSAESIPHTKDNIVPAGWEQDISKYFTGMDILVHIGGGFEFSMSRSTAFVLDIRYSRSIQSLWKDNPEQSVYTEDIMLIFGVLF